MNKRAMRVHTPSSPLVATRRIALSDSEEAEALADSLEDQFQAVTVPSLPAVIEMDDVEVESYFQTPASKPNLTNPDEVLEAIKGLKVGRTPGTKGILNRALKHLSIRAVLLLDQIFNAILCTHHFPPAWKDSTDIHTQTGKGSGAVLVLSAH
jgi:hypothetical protein